MRACIPVTAVCSTAIFYAKWCSVMKSRFVVVCEQVLHELISSDYGLIDLSGCSCIQLMKDTNV